MSDRNSYADGVPLYLNKKYYPIPRPKYKEIDCHIPLDALQEGYDFTVERQALSEYKEYEKEKKEREKYEEELRIRREIRAKEEAEASAAKAVALVREYEEEIAKQTKGSRDLATKKAVSEVLELSDDNSIRAGSSSTYSESNLALTTTQVEPSAAKPIVIPSSDNSTPSDSVAYPLPGGGGGGTGPENQAETVNYPHTDLQGVETVTYGPGPAPAPPPTTRPPTETRSYPQVHQEPLRPYEPHNYVPPPRLLTTTINLSDFESDTANPFDNVELKSINEMAVLAAVLQNNCTVPHHNNLNQSEPGRGTSSSSNGSGSGTNVNVNLNSLNGIVQPGVTYYPYLSQNPHNSNNSTTYHHPQQIHHHHLQWTPTSHNPFYSHFNSTMVTASSAMGTCASSDALPIQQVTVSAVPMQRPSPQQAQLDSTPTASPPSVSLLQHQQHQPNQLQPVNAATSSSENFANFYFPFTSSQAQSRLQNPDREFS